MTGAVSMSRRYEMRNQRLAVAMKWLVALGLMLALLPRAGSAKERIPFDPQLVLAIQKGDVARLKTFIDKGFDVNARDKKGDTALMAAALVGQLAVVKFLLDRGADPNTQGDRGWTALELAAGQSNADVVTALKERGAQVTLAAAAALGDLGRVKRFTEEGTGSDATAKQRALTYAAANGHLHVSRHLLADGASVCSTDAFSNSALMLAAERGHTAIVKLLIEKGADTQVRDICGKTPLVIAVQTCNQEMAKALIRAGADVNIRRAQDITPLHDAAYGCCKEIMQMLLTCGANVNARTRHGRTPLMVAAHSCADADLLRILVDHGADVAASDGLGRTVTDIAKDNPKSKSIMDYLKSLNGTKSMKDRSK